MEALNKMALYVQAAIALRSLHWRGLPLIPKSLSSHIPYSRSAYNAFITWIKRLDLPSARVIVDVGANHGDFANAASTCFPEAEAVLVEPLPELQPRLERYIRERRKKWKLLPCALGAERGRLPLFVDEGHDNIGSLAGFSEEYLKAMPQARMSKQIVCEVRTLDDVAAEMGIAHIDLLKIDVEGFEFEVMDGAERMLKNTLAVIIEVSLVRKTRTSTPLVEMIGRLTQNGFTIVNVFPSLFDPLLRWRPCEFNILARRADGRGG